jgi:YidC/Oxa1 family membrane protein insertase
VGDFFNTLLSPLTIGEAWVMIGWHKLWTLLGVGGGWAWALSIVGLTVVVRIVLIPLFVKQIHASRRMQLIQPEVQKIQAKYKGKTDPESRQALTQETMDLYKRTKTNPFASCLPILLQSPFFFALFTVLNNLKAISLGTHAPIGPISAEVSPGDRVLEHLRGAVLLDLPRRGGHRDEDRHRRAHHPHVGVDVH